MPDTTDAGASGPEAVVRGYLSAMEARDLHGARAMLAPGFEMRFPGTGAMTDLSELLDWARDRYSRIGKTIDAVDAIAGPPPVIWMRGRLHGDWPDGRPFSDIRFVDRFELDGEGRILRQDVWNDLAEARAKA